MKNKVVSIEEAVSHIKYGDTVMFGGFGGYGTPNNLVQEIVRQNIGGLTAITEDFSDGYKPFEMGLTALLSHKLVKKAVMSFAGGQPRVTEQVFALSIFVQLHFGINRHYIFHKIQISKWNTGFQRVYRNASVRTKHIIHMQLTNSLL